VFFEAALAWVLEFSGKEWVDGKNVPRHILSLFRALVIDLLSIVQVNGRLIVVNHLMMLELIYPRFPLATLHFLFL